MKRILFWTLVVALLALAPLVLRSYNLYLLNLAAVKVIAAVGLALLGSRDSSRSGTRGSSRLERTALLS